MELNIVSKEIIKPSSQTHNLKRYNLCLFDQLIPNTYLSIILFYPIHNDPKDLTTDHSKAITQLKKSLSETLTLYYPLSGKTKNNLYVDEFSTGVIFIEAKVKCQMSELFQGENELQNQLVPFQPFSHEKTEDYVPIIAFQLNIFSCGGIALGISLGHKNNDIAMLSNFLKSWSAISTGSPEKVIKPDLSSPAIYFPPRTNDDDDDDFLSKYTSLMDRLWFSEGDYVTKRFVFPAKSIETLKQKAKSERVPNPSRNLAISCLIWKHAMAASWAVFGSPKASIAGQAVNMRPRMKPKLDGAVGNFFWWSMASYDPNDYNNEVELSELVVQMKESITTGLFDEDYLSQLMMMANNKEGLVSEVENQLEIMSCIELENNADIFVFTNWKDFFGEVDFGFGKPLSVGSIGKVGPAFRNLVILVDADQWGKGSVDAFITLKAKEITLLQSDEAFLHFTFQNPVK